MDVTLGSLPRSWPGTDFWGCRGTAAQDQALTVSGSLGPPQRWSSRVELRLHFMVSLCMHLGSFFNIGSIPSKSRAGWASNLFSHTNLVAAF